MTYSEKFKDPRWQRKRLEIMDRDGFKCCNCDETRLHLNVHHAYYVKGRDPWLYPNFSLQTLCQSCHDAKHSPLDEDEEAVLEEWEEAIDFLVGGNPGYLSELWSVGCKFAMSGGCIMDKLTDLSNALAGPAEIKVAPRKYTGAP